MMEKYQVMAFTLLFIFGAICAENAWSHSNGMIHYNGGLAKLVAKTAAMACVNYGTGAYADPDPDGGGGSGNGPSPDDDYQVVPDDD